MQAPPAKTNRLALAAALLLLPGIWLRFHALDWMEFSGDELTVMYDSYRAAHERLALHGIPASIGIPLPNFLLYLLALPVTLTREPTQIVLFVAFWNLFGLACLLRLLWRAMPPAAALATTALLASAPGPLMLSRKVWNPDFVFTGVVLLLLLFALQLERPRRWVTIALFPVAALLCSFHASSWPLLPCLVVWAIATRVPLDRRGLLIGALSLLLLFLPYIWYFFQSEFDDLRTFAHRQAGNGVQSEAWLAAFARHARAAIEASCSGVLDGLPAGKSWAASALVARAFTFWTGFATLAACLCAPWFAWRAWKKRDLPLLERLLLLGALFELLLLASYAQTRVASLPHYYAVLIPFPTLAAVWLALRVSQRFGSLPLVGASALVVAAHTLLFASLVAGLQRGELLPERVYAPPFAPHAEKWRAEIARMFDEVDSGYALERQEQQRLKRLFDASQDVLMRYDPVRDEPPAGMRGVIELHHGADGLEVLGSNARDMLTLPPFDNAGRGRALLRLEIWSPKDVVGCVFYGTPARPDYGPGQAVGLRTNPGVNVLYLEISERDARGSPMLRHPAQHWRLLAAEMRRVED